MNAFHIILSFSLSVCQTLSNLVDFLTKFTQKQVVIFLCHSV